MRADPPVQKIIGTLPLEARPTLCGGEQIWYWFWCAETKRNQINIHYDFLWLGLSHTGIGGKNHEACGKDTAEGPDQEIERPEAHAGSLYKEDTEIK